MPPLTKSDLERRISLAQQIEEVQRELDARATVYPRLYAKGTLRTSVGQYQVQRMQAVLETLLWLKKNEQKIREGMTSAKEGERQCMTVLFLKILIASRVRCFSSTK